MHDIKKQQYISGRVRSVVYQNEDSGYSVIRVTCENNEEHVLVGFIPYAAPGETIEAYGRWVVHSTYGEQFKVESFTRTMPADEASVFEYLSHGAIKGIGPTLAKRIVGRFGEQTFNVLENEPHLLVDVKGITGAKAKMIGTNFKMQNGVRRLMEFLLENEVPPQLALRMYRRYGDGASDALKNNPYILTDEYFGVDFSKADQLAYKFGFSEDAFCRIDAAVLYELTFNLNQGHTFIPEDKLIDATLLLTSLTDGAAVLSAITRLQQDGQIVCEEIYGKTACYLSYVHEAERSVAECIYSMAHRRMLPPRGITKIVDEIEGQIGMTYVPAQRKAVLMSARSRVMLLTGGPGTGKTTTVKAMLALFERMRLKTAMAAPTGRAAKRMSELCGAEATTIHRLLDMEYDPVEGRFTFVHNEENPIDYDVVIIDETSMVDILLMNSLLKAIPSNCRLIMVGDPDQLPSVGPGNVLSDIIKSDIIDIVCLTDIFRQAEESRIVVNAHAVNHGRMPEIGSEAGDFFFLPCSTPSEVASKIVELMKETLPKKMGIDPSQIQVLSPTRRYETGTVNLNRVLQEALNPPEEGKAERRFGNFVLRQGDRVMQIKNNYDLEWVRQRLKGPEVGTGVFNGDIGVITEVNLRSETITVLFDDKEAVYSFDQAGELEPAYAITVHKSQGSEYTAVILAAIKGPAMLLCRRVLYTAITRAKSLMIIVGSKETVKVMVENHRQNVRFSGLRYRLEELEGKNTAGKDA